MNQILIFLSFFIFSFHLANGVVIGIDFGSEWMKIATIRSGGTMEVILNDQSQRKTPVVVGFNKDEDQFLGFEAKSLMTKNPDRVFINFQQLLGREWEDPLIDQTKNLYFPYNLDRIEDRNRIGVPLNQNTTLSPEDLSGMILSLAKKLSSKSIGTDVKDCVITVPNFFNQHQRQAILDAAKLAGLHVLGLISPCNAAAYYWAIERISQLSSENNTNAIFYDMGASTIQGSLVSFRSEKDKFNKTNVFVEVKAEAFDPILGGKDFDLRLRDHFADIAEDMGIPAKNSKRTMAKLLKEAQRIKEVLSANSETQVMIESLAEDKDFKYFITREKFYELCRDLFERVSIPMKQLLEKSNLSLEEISYVEVIGGGLRIPQVQKVLQETLKGKTLDKHLNGDESAVLGSSFFAAFKSPSFKTQAKFILSELVLAPINYTILSETGEEIQKGRLFNTSTPTHKAKTIILDQLQNITIQTYYDNEEPLPVGTKNELFTYNITSPTFENLNLSSIPKMYFKFKLDSAGILSLERAETKLSIITMVEQNKKSKKKKEQEEEIKKSDEEKENEEDKADEKEEDNEETVEPSNEEKEEEKELVPIVKNMTFPLKVERSVLGMTTEHFGNSFSILFQIQKKEEEKREKSRRRNELESFIYDMREKVNSDEKIEKVTTEEQREEFLKKLSEAEDWLYEDGYNVPAHEYIAKLYSLNSVSDDIQLRVKELTAYPKSKKNLNTYLLKKKKEISESEKYEEEEKERVLNVFSETEQWLEENSKKQEELAPHEKPIFLSSTISKKLKSLKDEVSKMKKKKPVEIPTNTTDSAQNETITVNEETTGNTTSTQESDKEGVEIPIEEVKEEESTGTENEENIHDEL